MILCIIAARTLTGCTGGGTSDTASQMITLATPFDDPARERQVASIYKAAKDRDAATLTKAAGDAARAHTPTDPAVSLALFILNPTEQAKDFVASYPTDARGVTLDYGTRLEAARIVPTGRRFPIAALGNFAVKGDPLALTKLFGAFAVAGEPTVRDYTHEIALVGSAIPKETLTAIAALPTTQQLDVIAGADWCDQKSSSAMMKIAASNPAETQVQNELRHRFTECPKPVAHKKKPRKHAHPPKHPHPHKAAGKGKQKPTHPHKHAAGSSNGTSQR